MLVLVVVLVLVAGALMALTRRSPKLPSLGVETEHAGEPVSLVAASGSAEVSLPETMAAGRSPVSVERSSEAASSERSASSAWAVRVLVVDPEGQPVEGIPVTLSAPSLDERFAIRRTDAHGEATLEPEGLELAQGEPLRIGTTWIGTTPGPVSFSPSDPPRERIRFVLEPAGSIEVVLVGGHDLEFYDEDQCLLRIGDDDCDSKVLEEIHQRYGYGTFVDRVALFPHVRLGACFTAYACLESHCFQEVHFDGPRVAGQRVRVELPLRWANAKLNGRVVSATGEGLSGYALLVSQPFELSGDLLTTVEPDGTFQAYQSPGSMRASGTPTLLRAVRVGSVAFTSQIPWPETTGTWSEDGGPRVDFGTIALSAEALLASGHVVDSQGRPTPATIEMRPTAPWRVDSWNSAGESDADGSFRISTSLPIERCELRAWAWGRSPGEAVAVTAGASDVRLALGEAGWIHGRVLLPPRIGLDDLDLSFRCIDHPDTSEFHVSSWETFEDGSFRVENLRPARYRMSVSLGDHELGSRDATVPASGGRIELEPVDLRESLHVLELTVLTEAGEPAEGAEVLAVRNEDSAGRTTVLRSGEAILAADDSLVDVVVSMPGFRSQRFDSIATGARLTLERGLSTTIRIDPWTALPDGCVLSADIHGHCDSTLAGQCNVRGIRFDANGSARVELPAACTYDVRFHLRGPGNIDREWRDDSARFDRPDSRATREVVLPADASIRSRKLDSLNR